MDKSKLDVTQAEAPPQGHESPAVKQMTSLQALCDDGVVLFTPALLVTHGGFPRDPVVEFVRTVVASDPQDLPFIVDSEYRFFDGFTPTMLNGVMVNWANRLYGVAAGSWPHLKSMLCSLAWVDPRRGSGGFAGVHELVMIDPHALSGHVLPELPTVTIHVFCAVAGRRLFYLAPATDPPRTLPSVRSRRATDEQRQRLSRLVTTVKARATGDKSEGSECA